MTPGCLDVPTVLTRDSNFITENYYPIGKPIKNSELWAHSYLCDYHFVNTHVCTHVNLLSVSVIIFSFQSAWKVNVSLVAVH